MPIAKRFTLIFVLMMSLAGCGAPTVPIRSEISPDGIVMSQVESIEKSGVLDTLELNLLDEGAFQILAEEQPATHFGVIRSREAGKFFLQVRRGLFDKYLDYPEWNIPLKGIDEAKTLKLAKRLNHLVILRGIMQGEAMEVRLIMPIASVGAVTELITKGRLTGTVYDNLTKTPVKDASMTLKAANGDLFRAISKQDGKYGFFRLPAGRYTLSVSKLGYGGYRTEVAVVGGRNAKTLVPLNAGCAPLPSDEPTVAPTVAPSLSPSPLPTVAPTTAPAPDPTVWVNTDSGIYHYPGTLWYGTTKHGLFMFESEAKARGCRASKAS